MKIRPIASLVGILLVTACAKGENAHPIDNVQLGDNAAVAAEETIDDVSPTANSAAAALPTDGWIGKWMGVEGLMLDIQPAGEHGHYLLSVTLLDGTNSYEGTAEGDMIRFIRNGRPESIRAATGDETGLKWLAGKQNCLMIQQGEGFCRDSAAVADDTPKTSRP